MRMRREGAEALRADAALNRFPSDNAPFGEDRGGERGSQGMLRGEKVENEEVELEKPFRPVGTR